MTAPADTVARTVRSPAFKLFLICVLILLLLVPLLMVMALVAERTMRANEVQSEVSRYWGGSQKIAGPYLIVPYTVRIETMQGDKRIEQTLERRAVFLPEELNVTASSRTEVLHRSIFDVNVYTADAVLEGRFLSPDIAGVDPNATTVRWKDAILSLTMSGVAGLKEAAQLEIAGAAKIPFAPSLGLASVQEPGIHARLAGAAGAVPADGAPPKDFSFRIPLSFTGSSSLMFAPAARETRVSLQSGWPHPSFSGAFLPAERSVRPDGFDAKWKVPHLARSVPNAWSLDQIGLQTMQPYMFGTEFYAPVDFYDLVTRAVKYGLLFLALGFMSVFVLELFSGKRVHPVQYLFVGTAMVFFYVLLLSLAEHIGFGAAYIAASAATGSMLSLYVGKALASTRSGIVMFAMFAAVYGFLYMILRLEDYALLAGALMGFVALTAVMFTTLKIDWSSSERLEEPRDEAA